jgi:hypothetical protein
MPGQEKCRKIIIDSSELSSVKSECETLKSKQSMEERYCFKSVRNKMQSDDTIEALIRPPVFLFTDVHYVRPTQNTRNHEHYVQKLSVTAQNYNL